MQQTWDASLYAGNGRFVALLADSLVEALEPKAGERILDLGCGDGFLTRRIGASGETIVGSVVLRPGIRRRLFQCGAALDERSGCCSRGRVPGVEAGGTLRGRMWRPG